jgi:choline dehydrogenase-like flavoprotein
MSDPAYDVVIVGSGIVGSILAFKLASAGKRVLIVEAGVETRNDTNGRGTFVEKFYLADPKDPESPYSDNNVNAPRPITHIDTAHVGNAQNDPGYWVQLGPQPFSSCYERQVGGTTWHWLGLYPRMLPNDFQMKSTYGLALDWPITYADLERFYRESEQTIGVAGDVNVQKYGGLWFAPGYQYPMPPVPPSYSDQQMNVALHGLTVWDKDIYLTSTPAARNTEAYDDRRACQGNTSCIPICPIQAKYDATIHLQRALQFENAQLWTQTVVDRVLVDENGRVSGLHYQQYADPSKPGASGQGIVTAKTYVLAAHAIETPKILLNSRTNTLPNGVANSSDQVGRNLMDHPFPVSWGLMPTPLYPMRGPRMTSGIETLRDGPFRKDRACFRVDVGNEGWTWVNDDPDGSVNALVGVAPGQGVFGAELRRQLRQIAICSLRIGFLIEQLPLASNRVTLAAQTDALGIPRPQIAYDIDPYCKRGFVAAREATSLLFGRMKIENRTTLLWAKPGDPGTFEVDGEWYQFFGAGHIAGTYRMGDDPKTSVVDSFCRSHDHENLFLVGTGAMVTVGTTNPTNTGVAIALRALNAILDAAS